MWTVAHNTIGALNKKHTYNNSQVLRLNAVIIILGYSMAFFDGAASAGGSNFGAGGSLKCADGPYYIWNFNCGTVSNNKVELLGVWATLTISKRSEIQHIQLLGDSKVIIVWLNQIGNLRASHIEGWKIIIRDLVAALQGIIFQHIFRE
jgi:ribonuclease HI